MADDEPGRGGREGMVAGAPSDNTTLTAVLSSLADVGYSADFRPVADGSLRCPHCGTHTPAADVDVELVRRLEGASEPDEEQIVIGFTCPACGTKGTVVLGYGVNAGEVDAAVITDLRFDLHGG